MNNENSIIEMLRLLRKNNIFSTEDFEKDIIKLVTTNIKKFVQFFSRDMRRRDLEHYNRCEILNLTRKQKQYLEGNNLYRYEYRINSNMKCIYIIENVNNTNRVNLLCAFNEDGEKTKGKNSYKDNINRAIRIYLNNN